MNIRRLLLAGTFNFSLAVFAGLFGISQTLGDALGFDPLSRRFWLGVLSADSALGRYVLEHRASTAIAGALLLIIVGLVTGIIRTTVRDFGFRLQRTDAGLRRRRGLLTRTDVTLPVSRAQAIVLRSGPVRAWFGWTKVTVQSLARDDGGGSDHVLAPLATGSEAATITSELGWRPVPSDVEWTRVSRAYVWMRVIAVAPLVPIALAQVLVDVRLGAGLAALLLAAIGGRWLARRRTAYGVDGDRLLIRSGWWQRRLVLLPKAKIQSIDVYETFVSRWFGTATLQLGTAGSGAGGHSIPAIPSGTARALRRQLLGSSA